MKSLKNIVILYLLLFLWGCCGSQSTTTTSSTVDSIIVPPPLLIIDTSYLPQIYYGGYNPNCDTAAILASAGFSIEHSDTMGQYWKMQYSALEKRVITLSAMKKPEKIIVPVVHTFTEKSIQKSSFRDILYWMMIGGAIVLGLTFIIIPIIKKIPSIGTPL